MCAWFVAISTNSNNCAMNFAEFLMIWLAVTNKIPKHCVEDMYVHLHQRQFPEFCQYWVLCHLCQELSRKHENVAQVDEGVRGPKWRRFGGSVFLWDWRSPGKNVKRYYSNGKRIYIEWGLTNNLRKGNYAIT